MFFRSSTPSSSKSFVPFNLVSLKRSALFDRTPFTGVASSSSSDEHSTLSFGIGDNDRFGSPNGERKGERYGDVQTGEFSMSLAPPHTDRAPPGDETQGETFLG